MFSIRSLVVKNRSMMTLARNYRRLSSIAFKRNFSSGTQMQSVGGENALENMTEEEKLIHDCEKFGADLAFNNKKHSYILSFPWNFDNVISKYEQKYMKLSEKDFWHKWIFNRECDRDFNELFRVFHQSCAIPDYEGIERVCEPRLAKYISRSVENIRFHGMNIEMANLTVHQPKIEILNVEISHGLSVDKSENLDEKDYNITESTMMGAPMKLYTKKSGDDRSVLDFLDSDYKPYLVSVTALIHSPMKLFVWNQNKTRIIFGSNDNEVVKHVVKFETN